LIAKSNQPTFQNTDLDVCFAPNRRRRPDVA
jgi:hypothetical protein